MPRLPTLAPAACLMAACCLPATAHAGVTWLCGLSQDLTRIVCVADPDTASDTQASATAVVRGTRFPLDPQRVYTVDLWSPTTDAEGAEFLARATICYRSPGCEVRFTAPMLQAAARKR